MEKGEKQKSPEKEELCFSSGLFYRIGHAETVFSPHTGNISNSLLFRD